jgi:hypothetical protein
MLTRACKRDNIYLADAQKEVSKTQQKLDN